MRRVPGPSGSGGAGVEGVRSRTSISGDTGAKHAWSIASRELDQREVRTLLLDPDEPFGRPETIIIKRSRTTTVAETTMTVRGQRVAVIYKRFNRKKWLDPVLTYFRPSRAWQAWQAGQHLLSRAVPTPKNLAFLARQKSFRDDPCSGICRTRRI